MRFMEPLSTKVPRVFCEYASSQTQVAGEEIVHARSGAHAASSTTERPDQMANGSLSDRAHAERIQRELHARGTRDGMVA